VAQKAFEHPRYLTVEGKPMFVIIAPHDLPSTADFIHYWRALAAKAGYPGLYFAAVANKYAAGIDLYRNSILAPFDAITPLVPQDYLDTVARDTRFTDLTRRFQELNLGRRLNRFKGDRWQRPTGIRYDHVVSHALRDMPPGDRYLPCVLPG
jgi:hypothetical protein